MTFIDRDNGEIFMTARRALKILSYDRRTERKITQDTVSVEIYYQF